jgi:hypothetical protein
VFILLGATFTPEEDMQKWIIVLGYLAGVAFIGHLLAQVWRGWH